MNNGILLILGLLAIGSYLFGQPLIGFIFFIMLAGYYFVRVPMEKIEKHESPGVNTKIWGKVMKEVGRKTGDQIVKSDQPWGSHHPRTRTAASAKTLIEGFKELFE